MNFVINKDIDKYSESVLMGLSVKQLLYSCLSLGVGGATVLLLSPYVGLTVSAYISIPFVAPIAMSGFYSYHGMSFMEVTKSKLKFMIRNHPLVYVSTEGEGVIKEFRVEKERGIYETKNIFRSIKRIKKSK